MLQKLTDGRQILCNSKRSIERENSLHEARFCYIVSTGRNEFDEPTSHLDIESIEVLEQLLQDFAGGFLLISHDRSFVGTVAEKLYALDRGKLTLV